MFLKHRENVWSCVRFVSPLPACFLTPAEQRIKLSGEDSTWRPGLTAKLSLPRYGQPQSYSVFWRSRQVILPKLLFIFRPLLVFCCALGRSEEWAKLIRQNSRREVTKDSFQIK